MRRFSYEKPVIFASMHEIGKLFCQMEKFNMLFLQTRFFESLAHKYYGQPVGVPQDGFRKKMNQKTQESQQKKRYLPESLKYYMPFFMILDVFCAVFLP